MPAEAGFLSGCIRRSSLDLKVIAPAATYDPALSHPRLVSMKEDALDPVLDLSLEQRYLNPHPFERTAIPPTGAARLRRRCARLSHPDHHHP